MRFFKFFLISLFVITLDQASKLLVYYYMEFEGAEINVLGDWFKLHYVLNPGIAFGINFDTPYSKFFLTSFRLVASVLIGYFLYTKSKEASHAGFLLSISLVFAGAVGNVIDSVFYGVFLDGNVIPGSFTPWFHGQVIDMLYFPLFKGEFPGWLPVLGGNDFSFFSAIFNIADSSIFIGVVTIVLFQKKFLSPHEEEQKDTHTRLAEQEINDSLSANTTTKSESTQAKNDNE
jgi:signal peptidase II